MPELQLTQRFIRFIKANGNYNKTVQPNKGEAEVDIYCISDSLKMPKFIFLLLLRSESSLAMLTRKSRYVLSLWLFNIVRLLNRSCLIAERKHIFNLRSMENDLSPDALFPDLPI